MSLVAFAGGALLLLGFARAEALRRNLPRPDAKAMFENVTAGLVVASRRAVAGVHDGSLPRYAG